MKKSKNISKYDLNWQVTRYLAKKEKSLEKKLKIVRDFLFNNKTVSNQERCLNWLEGLALGYKKTNQEAIMRIESEITRFEDISLTDDDNVLSFEDKLVFANKIDSEIRIGLWKDLFKRNEKWLVKGYFHREQNDFLDMLYLTLCNEDLENYSYEKLKQLREAALTMDNTHKFFF